ncbi:MAG: DUF4390 domain-containing protein [Burkholderiaceae bacterium]
MVRALLVWTVVWTLSGLVSAAQSDLKTPPRVPIVQLSELALIDDPVEGVIVSGQVQVTLSAALIQAIERGVPLRFVSTFQVIQPRWWWWDRQAYSRTRSADLVFHPLTRQFRVTIDGAPPLVYADFGEALRASLAVKGWRVAGPASGMTKEGVFRIRLSLDLGALPKAIQVTALTSEQWAFDSGWSRIDDTRAKPGN